MKTPLFLLLVLIPICVFGRKIARLLPRREPLPSPVSEIYRVSEVNRPRFEIVEPKPKFEIVGSEDDSKPMR
jgi:hypothetical protein